VAVVVAEGEAVTEGQTLARLEDGRCYWQVTLDAAGLPLLLSAAALLANRAPRCERTSKKPAGGVYDCISRRPPGATRKEPFAVGHSVYSDGLLNKPSTELAPHSNVVALPLA
jgi:hypothetical protein